MAQHLVEYITTPFFMIESLYDVWQLAMILQIPCVKLWPKYPMDGCNQTEMAAIHAFRNKTVELLNTAIAIAPKDRSIWAPSCAFHCDTNFGLIGDPLSANYTVPPDSNNTLGLATH